MPKLIRITTIPMSLDLLLTGQMGYMKGHGWEVLMVSNDGPERERVIQREGCEHILLRLTRQITPFQDLVALWKMILLIRREKPDVVHSHTPKAGIIGMLAAWIAGVPVRIHTVAGMPLQLETGLKRKILEFVEKATYRAATEVWPNSHSLNDYILNHNLGEKGKLEVIGHGSTNGIQLTDYSPDQLDETILNCIKNEIEYDSDLRYLVFVGRVVSDKGVNELVRVFDRLSTEYPDLHLLLVGPLESDLDPLDQDTMTDIRRNSRIHAVGYSTNVPYYLHLATLLIFPSHREGFPNVPMQAALMDCPVVCSDIGGNIDIVDHLENGLLFEVGNENDLCVKVKYGLENPKEMQMMVSRLKQKIKENFSREYVQNEILQNYNRLLEG